MIQYTTAFFVTACIFLVAIIYFIAVCIKTKKAKEKIGGKIVSGLISVLSFLSIALTPVPTPTIYPLEDSVRVYEGIVEIEIKPNDSSPFIHTYYSLDGSDPEDGYIYEGSFIITSSTTVYAKNKFLWRWSEPNKSAYRFESIPITISNGVDPNIDDKFISLNEIGELGKIFLGFIIVIYLLKITLIDGFKNLFRS